MYNQFLQNSAKFQAIVYFIIERKLIMDAYFSQKINP